MTLFRIRVIIFLFVVAISTSIERVSSRSSCSNSFRVDQTEPVFIRGTVSQSRVGTDLFVAPGCGARFYPTTANAGLHAGDFVLVSADIRPLAPRRNPYDFDEKGFLRSKNVFLVAERLRVLVVDHGRHDRTLLFLWKARSWVATRIEGVYEDTEISGLLNAMLLGDRSRMPTTMKEGFRATGLAHLLAISGLHFGTISATLLGLISVILRRLPLSLQTRRRLSFWLVIVAMAFYTFLVKASPSVIRAFVMMGMTVAAWSTGRKYILGSALLRAFLVLVVLNPIQIFNAGFLLSFSAVAGIAVGLHLGRSPRVVLLKKSCSRSTWGVVFAVWISFCASVFTSPFVLYFIGFIPLLSFLLGPLAIWLTTISLALSLVTVIFSPLLDSLAPLSILLFHFLLSLVDTGSTISFQPTIQHAVGEWNFAAFILLFLLLAMARVPWQIRTALINLMLLGVFISVLARSEHELEVSFLDVGQGDAAILSIAGKTPLVVDTGPENRSGRAVARHLSAVNNSSAEYGVVLTHPHQDHTGGMAFLTESLPQAQIIHSGWYEDNSSPLSAPGIRVERGQTIDLIPETRIYVLHPPSSIVRYPSSNENDNSVVLLVVFGQTRFLLLGDVEMEAERMVLDNYAPFLGVDVVKIAHHGSKTSSLPELVNASQPRYAVVSVGLNNRFLHPDIDVLERWKGARAQVLSTAEHGAIEFKTDGLTLQPYRPMVSGR